MKRALKKNIQPWERQPGETARAFAAFVSFRSQPSETRRGVEPGRLGGDVWAASLRRIAAMLEDAAASSDIDFSRTVT